MPTPPFDTALLDAVSDPGRAVTNAVTLAARIAANSPAAVSATLRAIHAATAELDSQGWLATDRAVTEAETSPDHNEGIDAFFEKRAARWSPLPSIGCPVGRAGRSRARQRAWPHTPRTGEADAGG